MEEAQVHGGDGITQPLSGFYLMKGKTLCAAVLEAWASPTKAEHKLDAAFLTNLPTTSLRGSGMLTLLLDR